MISHRLIFVAWVVFSLGISQGCREGNSDPIQQEMSRDQALEPASSDATIRPITVEQWIEQGLPSLDEVWRVDEMIAATNAFTYMSRDDLRYLPRLDDEPSAPIFQRLVAEENMTWYRDKRVDQQLRLIDAQSRLRLLATVISHYLKSDSAQITQGTELIYLYGQTFDAFTEILQLIDEGSESTDANQIAQLGTLRNQAITGGIVSAHGGLKVLKESEQYRLDDRKLMIRHLEKYLPALLRQTSNSTRDEVIMAVRELEGHPATEDLQTEIAALIKQVEQ